MLISWESSIQRGDLMTEAKRLLPLVWMVCTRKLSEKILYEQAPYLL